MRPVQLPDCAARDASLGLTARQRRELVRLLAEEGPEALEAWIEHEAQRDPHIRERIDRARARLEREARDRRERLEDRYASTRERVAAEHERKLQELAQREQSLRGRLDQLDREPGLEELVDRSTLLRAGRQGAEAEAQRSRWGRFKRALYRAWLWLIDLWVRFVRWLRGERPQGEADATLRLPEGASLDLPSLLAANPSLRVEVRKRLTAEAGLAERVRHWWRRLLGREHYAEVARELMAEELATRRRELEQERRDERRQLQDELERVERREEAVEVDKDEAIDEVQREERRALEELERELQRDPMRQVSADVLEELAEAGFVGEGGRPTEALMHRFAAMLREEVLQALPRGGRVTPGAFTGSQGEYERRPLRSLNERGSMDLVATVVNARTHHPGTRHLYDEDILVHREVRTHTTHVVLVFDRSGSMESHGRFEAAKRVCLVMHQTVRDQGGDHRIDLLGMSTGVEEVDLSGVWNAELGGFTNQHAALKEARRRLEAVDADRKLVYLITDGLPEAYVDETGENQVDDPDVCIAYAREEAAQLRRIDARLLILQLETEDELYLEAAREVAEPAGGRVIGLEPERLMEEVVLDFEAQAG